MELFVHKIKSSFRVDVQKIWNIRAEEQRENGSKNLFTCKMYYDIYIALDWITFSLYRTILRRYTVFNFYSRRQTILNRMLQASPCKKLFCIQSTPSEWVQHDMKVELFTWSDLKKCLCNSISFHYRTRQSTHACTSYLKSFEKFEEH